MNFNFLNTLPRKHLLMLLAVIVLTDGYINRSRKTSPSIRLSTMESSKAQHNFFRLLCLKLFGKEPKRYRYGKYSSFSNKTKMMLHSELTMTRAVKELDKLSPTFKTTPGPEGKDAFLSSKQPSLKFLFEEPKNMKQLALRTWFDFDGSVVPSFKLKTKKDRKGSKVYTYYQVQFECEINLSETNPQLSKELVEFCNALGINARLRHSKRKWSGIEGIQISELRSVKKILKMGPITDVKISGKSKRFKNISKRTICNYTLHLLKNSDFSISKSFKDKKEALRYKNQQMNYLIIAP